MPKYILESVNVALDEMNRLAGLPQSEASSKNTDVQPDDDETPITELFGKHKRTAKDLERLAKKKGNTKAAAYWAARDKKKPSFIAKASKSLKKIAKKINKSLHGVTTVKRPPHNPKHPVAKKH
jgi:hypothetical protein